MDRDVAAKRKKDSLGLTTRERQVLTMRVRHEKMLWKDIAATLGVTKFRVTEIKRNLLKKGMLDPDGSVSEEGRMAVDAKMVDKDAAP